MTGPAALVEFPLSQAARRKARSGPARAQLVATCHAPLLPARGWPQFFLQRQLRDAPDPGSVQWRQLVVAALARILASPGQRELHPMSVALAAELVKRAPAFPACVESMPSRPRLDSEQKIQIVRVLSARDRHLHRRNRRQWVLRQAPTLPLPFLRCGGAGGRPCDRADANASRTVRLRLGFPASVPILSWRRLLPWRWPAQHFRESVARVLVVAVP